MAENSTVDAVIFDGGYGIDYVEFAADIFAQVHEGSTVEVSPSTQIASELQPRFVGGNPPDLIDNSGAQSIGFNTILDQLEDLTDVIDAPNLEGVTIRDTLYGGVLSPGTFGGKLAAINYALTVYGVWYSGSLFEENGWTPPTTWAEALELGAAAKEQDKYLFCWGQEAATYYQTMSIESAIKEGGDEVRLAVENLEEGCWSHPAVQAVFTGAEGDHRRRLHAAGRRRHAVHPGPGAVEPRPGRDAVPVGLVDRERDEGADRRGLRDEGRADVDGHRRLGDAGDGAALDGGRAVHRARPQGANVAGGKELLRIMLSTEAATNFAKTKLAPTIVGGPRPRGRLRLDGAGVADRDAGGGRRGHLQLRLRRLLRHQPGPAAALELVPGR